ncbi:hypothetical protein [Paenibacillus sp. sgz302251]|uniref:hypothetical protein n=1 Tax=Paenibacillus sp. sgz302251 TaxID=3414493 RepID=UPI003C7D201E
MTRKLAIFDTEQQAIHAIQQLEQSGFVPGELKVLTKDSEHSRRIEAESDVHADELRELEEASAQDAHGLDGPGVVATAGSGGIGFVGAYGLVGYGAASSYAGGGYPYAAVIADHNQHHGVLQALGLDDKEAEACYQALQNGSVIVIAETDESKSLLDKDGGPDLSRLGVAEAVMRQCNASSIVAET